MNAILSIAAISFYLCAGILQHFRLYGRLHKAKFLILAFALLAVILHAFVLYHWIDTEVGQNLTFFNVLSQIAWLISLLLILATLLKPVENLGIFIYPFAAISIVLGLLFPGQYLIQTGKHPEQLVHILLSFLAVSIFFIAATQAVLLAIQNHMLRQRNMLGIVKALPPVETMESLLFQMLSLGFIILSLVLVSSVILFPNIFNVNILQHTLLAIFAWIVFAILLFGRKLFGWRGKVAVFWTLSGAGLLIISYFGSRLLVEMLV